MKVFLITSAKTRHIIPASINQWNKYTPFDPIVIDVLDMPLDGWTTNVKMRLIAADIRKEEKIILALDDFLVIDKFNHHIFNFVKTNYNVDRYELGWGALNKKPSTCIHKGLNYEVHHYLKDAPYKISCQPSLWKVKSLLEVLGNQWSPWEFEIKGSEKYNHFNVIGTKGKFALRYQEETALSMKRNKGKINMLGVKPSDVDELVNLGHIDRSKINYGINNGPSKFDISLAGRKYEEFYG